MRRARGWRIDAWYRGGLQAAWHRARLQAVLTLAALAALAAVLLVFDAMMRHHGVMVLMVHR